MKMRLSAWHCERGSSLHLQIGKSYSTPREALLLNGKFVMAQLGNADSACSSSKFSFAETPFMATLKQEVGLLKIELRSLHLVSDRALGRVQPWYPQA